MKIKNYFYSAILFASISSYSAQDSKDFGYTFTPRIELTETSVKSQDMTGTCWSYSASSFLESEAARISGHVVDLSEMATVRYTYPLKAAMYIRLQGKHQFSAGSLAHDVINAASGWGLVPQNVYTGLKEGETVHNHDAMDKALKAAVDTILTKPNGKIDPYWMKGIDEILDEHIGAVPRDFVYEGETYTPETFRNYLGIDPYSYINITSFTHHPFGESFILEIPDNFSRGEFFNVPIDEMQQLVQDALIAGYTVAWDADVSEKGFSFSHGVALLPAKGEEEKLWKEEVVEAVVTQESRQMGFEDQTTTDDHLMHITGLASDQSGNKYFIVKNSWGQNNPYGGHQYVSMAYFRAKTIAILVNNEAVVPAFQGK
jgi:bleomycin hydrolase|tara:strand:+ start:293 stop:1411 length:1119 start_codon:yes stop_codon:yes gene_type:complete